MYTCAHDSIEKYVLKKETPLVVAVSGGIDSVCLLHMLFAQGYKNIHVAHVNHMWRDDAEDDALFVRKLADAYGYSFHLMTKDMKQGAKESRDNLENYSRKERYAYFENVRNETGSMYILTAHHKDDATESQLLHILRGTHLQGLVRMKVCDLERKLLRPLLSISKKELYAYAKKYRIAWKEDSTNEDTMHARNHLRNIVLPVLAQKYSHFEEALESLSRCAEEMKEYMEEKVYENMGKNVFDTDTWPYAAYLSLHPSEQKYFLKEVLMRNGVSGDMTRARIEELQKSLSQLQSGKYVDVSMGYVLERSFDTLSFKRKPENIAKLQKVFEYNDLQNLPTNILHKYTFTKVDPHEEAKGVRIPFCLCKDGIVIRQRTPGDKVVLPKSQGVYHKSLKKFLIEQQYPVEEREHLLLMTSKKTGEVLHILGDQKQRFPTDSTYEQYLEVTCNT